MERSGPYCSLLYCFLICLQNFCPEEGKPHPVGGTHLPLVLGHEYSGTIVKVGKNLQSKYKEGQNVACQPDFGCQKCVVCKDGRRNVCSSMGFIGLSGPGTALSCGFDLFLHDISAGGLGQFSALSPENFHLLPDNVPLDIGALVEPLAVAWHAVRASSLRNRLVAKYLRRYGSPRFSQVKQLWSLDQDLLVQRPFDL